MHNSPISKDFYKDIVNVLSGKTTTKVELPVSLVESANQASVDLAHAFLDGGTVSLEKKRDILRKNLKEGAAKCGCTLNPDMIARFEELSAQAPVAKHVELVELQTPERAATTRRAAQEAKTLDWYERTSPDTYGEDGKIVGKAGKAGKVKTKRALSAAQKVDGFVKSLYKNSFEIDGESLDEANEVTEEIVDTETTADQLVEMSAGLTQFIAQLNQDEVRILKNLLSNH